MPGEATAPVIKENKDGSIVFQYHPTVQGNHECNVSFNEKPVEGSPFKCVVDKMDGGFVTAYGFGLSQGMSGDESSFTVVTKDGGAGKLNVSINGPSKPDMKRKDNADGTSWVTYMPMTPGEYNVSIKYGGKNITGSPFCARISGEGRKRSQIFIGMFSEVALGGKADDIVNLIASLKTPSGGVEPCITKKQEDGQLVISSFTPLEKGAYTVSCYKDEKHIPGSPFKLAIGEGQIGSAAKVKVTGDALKKGTANKVNTIQVNAKNAGYGGLGFSLEGGHRADIGWKDGGDGTISIDYTPHEPGIYMLNLRFADQHVPGSPFMVTVGGESSGRIRESLEQQVPACDATGPGSKLELNMMIPGTSPFDMEASVTSPKGVTELCEIMDLEHSVYDIKFQPTDLGKHIISIKYKGLHISGSPLPFSIGPPPADGGVFKVEAGGMGLERAEVGISNDFNIYTHEAGAGLLNIAIEGASKATIKREQRSNGCSSVSYKVTKPGKYGVHIKYNDKHIPRSPFIVHVAPDSGDAKKVTAHSIQDRGLAIGKPCTFTVNYNGATGHTHAHVITPTGQEEDCFVQEMDAENYAIRFIPKDNGVHYVHVKLNDAHIPGSPFPFLVGKTAADPAMVHAYGDGLDKGLAGRKCKFVVNTTQAGPGILTVTVDGPSRVAISCKDMNEGYEISYTPLAAGEYTINIKFGNIGIAGSPSVAVITGTGRKASPIMEQSTMVVETVEKKPGATPTKKFTGDASKVVAKGLGLKKAFLGRLSTFTIDIKDAGHAMLMVGLMSPTGEPAEEMSTKHTSRTSYTCSYKPKGKGEYQLGIKWGDDDVPGSPFNIVIT